MKILIVSSYLPYPLISGGQVRLYNLIKELSKIHDITLICEIRPNQSLKDISEVEKICKKVITVARKKQWSIANILKSIFSSHSFLATGHSLQSMQALIKEEIEKNLFNLIHVETYYVYQNIPTTNIPIVLIEHNIEYNVYNRYVSKAPLILRPLLLLDVKKIKNEEETCWNNSDALVTVSTDDKKVMEKQGLRPTIVANGVDLEKFVSKNIEESFHKSDKKLLFIGDFNWIQNIDSVKFIISNIWPLLEKEAHNSALSPKLWIVGRKIPNSIRRLSNNPNIIFDEKSSYKQTPEIFQEATILLAPIRIGGGTSYKILEAMACGTPVVTMPLSAGAIEAKDGEQIMVGTSALELFIKSMELLTKIKTYVKISNGGRKLIEEKYSWTMISKQLNQVYSHIVEKHE